MTNMRSGQAYNSAAEIEVQCVLQVKLGGVECDWQQHMTTTSKTDALLPDQPPTFHLDHPTTFHAHLRTRSTATSATLSVLQQTL